jgi:hypothetical protein
VQVPNVNIIDMGRFIARVMHIPPLRAVSWKASNRLFLGTLGGILAGVYLFVLLVDPYGVVPFSPQFERPLMSAQRQMYPQILRTGRYDSIIVGTSTIRLLDPAALDRAVGGHFASMAMPAETAWEQVQILDYFRRTVAAPDAVLIGIDHEWCYRGSNVSARDIDAVREKAFPSWAYDDGNWWIKVLYLLNRPTLDMAAQTIGQLLGQHPEKLRRDGYEISLANEAAYSTAEAHHKIWDAGATRKPSFGQRLDIENAWTGAMDFPALPWLDESLAQFPGTVRKFLVLPPIHARMLPEPGSIREALEAECKRRVAAIARRRSAILVDWRIASPLAAEDRRFRDLIHYRLPVAQGMINDLAHIVHEGRESPDGSYRILVR